MSLPPLALEIAKEGWPLASVQRAWALIPLGSVPAAFLTARLSRALSEEKLLHLSIAVAAAAFSARALPTGFIGYAFVLLIYGAATGIMLTLLTVQVSRSVGDKRSGMAQAIFFSAYAVGVAIGLSTAEQLLDILGSWRASQLFWGLLSAALALLTWRYFPKQEAVPAVQTQVRLPPEKRFRAARYALTYGCYTAAYLALSNTLPTHLRLSGWSPAGADLVFAGSTLAFVFGSAVWAVGTDYFGYRNRAFTIAMCGAGLSVLAVWYFMKELDPVWAVNAILLTGFFAGGAPLFFSSMLSDKHFAEPEMLTVAALATSASYLGGFLAPFSVAGQQLSSPWLTPALIALLFFLSAFALPVSTERILLSLDR